VPNNPKITFPLDGDTVKVHGDAPVFIAHGRVILTGNATPAGLNGHLVAKGTETVKVVGSLIA